MTPWQAQGAPWWQLCVLAGIAYGIELNPAYAEIARQVIAEEKQSLGPAAHDLACELITGDAANITEIAAESSISHRSIMCSPPRLIGICCMPVAQPRKKIEGSAEDLDVFYSDDPNDLGNISDYEQFIERLTQIYIGMQPIIRPGAYLTIIVKNIKKGGKIYPLAWDLARRLGDTYTLKDEKIWCQDNQRLSPYGLGNAWVSNTFHHYCLQFRNE